MLISTFMAAVEGTVISTAMPAIVERLGEFALFPWAFGIYLLAQAVTTPLYGRLANSYGRKPVFLASTSLFLIGSVLCGCAWSMGSLIAFRGLQGLGGGGLVPLAITIIGDVTRPSERARMLGYVSAVWGMSAIIGPLMGAFLVDVPGWPFVFWINIPAGVLAIAIVFRCLHEPIRERQVQRIDWWGCGLLMLGTGAIMIALVQAKALTPFAVGASATLAIVSLTSFAWRERRAGAPLFGAYLLRRPIVLAATASAALCGALLTATTAFLPTWVQGVRHGTTLQAGFVLGVLTVSWTIANMSVGRLMSGVAYRPVAVGASLASLVGFILLAMVSRESTIIRLDLASVMIGVGLGVNSLVFTLAIQSGVREDERGRATALFYFCRMMGQSLGAACFGSVLNMGIAERNAGLNANAIDLLGTPHTLPPDSVEQITALLARGLQGVFALAAVIAACALLVALAVPPAEGLNRDGRVGGK